VAPKAELVRIALIQDDSTGARAVLDREGKLAGRGAYLCRDRRLPEPAAGCVAQAARNRGIARTLRAGAGIDSELLESMGR
jgi:predicted RNA-binding protein YlxR (DUF448 family)